jgi:hypothetical protein
MSCDAVKVGDIGPSQNLFNGSLALFMAHGSTQATVLDELEPNAPDIAHELETKVAHVSLTSVPLERFYANTPANSTNLNERFPHRIRQANVKRYRRKRFYAKILTNHSSLPSGCPTYSVMFYPYGFSRLKRQYGMVTLDACTFTFDNVGPYNCFASLPFTYAIAT